MMAAFAMETYAENYNLASWIERCGVYSLTNFYVPGKSNLARQINLEVRRAEAASAIRGHYLVLTGSGAVLPENAAVRLEDGESADDLIEKLFAADDELSVSDIQFSGEFTDPSQLSDVYTAKQNQKIMKRNAELVNAEDIVSTAAKLYSGGKEYLLCMDTARFSGRWYICNASGNLADLLGANSSMQGMIPLDAEEYADVKRLAG